MKLEPGSMEELCWLIFHHICPLSFSRRGFPSIFSINLFLVFRPGSLQVRVYNLFIQPEYIRLQRRVVFWIHTRLLTGYDQVSVGNHSILALSLSHTDSCEICSLSISSFIKDELFVMFFFFHFPRWIGTRTSTHEDTEVTETCFQENCMGLSLGARTLMNARLRSSELWGSTTSFFLSVEGPCVSWMSNDLQKNRASFSLDLWGISVGQTLCALGLPNITNTSFSKNRIILFSRTYFLSWTSRPILDVFEILPLTIAKPINSGTMVFLSPSRNYINDSLRTDIFLRFKPETIACACIDLAARNLQVNEQRSSVRRASLSDLIDSPTEKSSLVHHLRCPARRDPLHYDRYSSLVQSSTGTTHRRLHSDLSFFSASCRNLWRN